MTAQETISVIDQAIQKDFKSNRRILSFDEYLKLLTDNSSQQLRGSAQYLIDTMDYFGKEEVTPEHKPNKGKTYRFGIFDGYKEDRSTRIIGHEKVQTQIYQALKSFARQKLNNKLILLHGPNGSAKSTIAQALMKGLEKYSKTEEGAIYTFNWIFPIEKITKGGIGIHKSYDGKPGRSHDTFAHLSDEEIAARVPSELKDHPILLIPSEHRLEVLKEILGEKKGIECYRDLPSYLAQGDLSHRNKQFFEALLVAYEGDYQRVLKHIQVERYYFSRRYRKGLVTIEPQMHVDARYERLSYEKSLGNLPTSLQNISLFSLQGDLVDSNRGMVEFSDLLKRPVDSFKYLLGACETGAVNVGSSIAYLDTLFIGSTNELQLDAFKEFPDFSSFKARIELIRVPYLLEISKEKEIYSMILEEFEFEKTIAPHVAWTLSLWAILSRLKKPNSINYPPNVSTLISSLSPIDKARLYDKGQLPQGLLPEDRKLLRTTLPKLKEEYAHIPYYEGRMGASVREIKSILFDAVHNPEFPCLSPLAIMHEMEEFIKKVSEYEFLKQDVKDGYHDAKEFIKVVRNEYLDIIDREVRESMGLYNQSQWEEFIGKYVSNISLILKKEKVKNPVTGKMVPPDQSLIREFEDIVSAPKSETERENFRQQIISRVGAWSLDHPGQVVVYSKVFPEYWTRIEKHFYESQKTLLTKMHDAVLVYGKNEQNPDSEGAHLARDTIKKLSSEKGYDEESAKEIITFLLRERY